MIVVLWKTVSVCVVTDVVVAVVNSVEVELKTDVPEGRVTVEVEVEVGTIVVVTGRGAIRFNLSNKPSNIKYNK